MTSKNTTEETAQKPNRDGDIGTLSDVTWAKVVLQEAAEMINMNGDRRVPAQGK